MHPYKPLLQQHSTTMQHPTTADTDVQWLDNSGNWQVPAADCRQRLMADSLALIGREADSHDVLDLTSALELHVGIHRHKLITSASQRATSAFLVQSKAFQASAAHAQRSRRVERAIIDVMVGNYTRCEQASLLPPRRYFLQRYLRRGCIVQREIDDEHTLTVGEALAQSRTELDAVVEKRRAAVCDAVRSRCQAMKLLNQSRVETYEHFAAENRALIKHRRSSSSIRNREEQFCRLFVNVFPGDIEDEIKAERTAANLFQRLGNGERVCLADEPLPARAASTSRRSLASSWTVSDIGEKLLAAYPALENVADIPLCSRLVHAGSSPLVQPARYVSSAKARFEHEERWRSMLRRWEPVDRLRFCQAFYNTPKEWEEIGARCGFRPSECVEYYYLRKSMPVVDPIGYGIEQYREAAAEHTAAVVAAGSAKDVESFGARLQRRMREQPAWIDSPPRVLPLFIKQHTRQMINYRETNCRKLRTYSGSGRKAGRKPDRIKNVASIRVGDVTAQQHWENNKPALAAGGAGFSPASKADTNGVPLGLTTPDGEETIKKMAEGLLRSVVEE